MNIEVKRIALKDTYTIGKLYIDGAYFCDTLEDKDRGLEENMPIEKIMFLKKPHITAIPTGTYTVILNYSNRFKRIMPLVMNVKGFAGIRIHAGNTSEDTDGCILVGENKAKGKVLNSKDTYNRLLERIKSADKVYLTVSY
jgi:hypothetical protein|nr:MAG TPA: hypothetical protein [Crassvirales sp.]